MTIVSDIHKVTRSLGDIAGQKKETINLLAAGSIPQEKISLNDLNFTVPKNANTNNSILGNNAVYC